MNDNDTSNIEEEKVGKSFYCFDNQLTSLAGAPEEVGENFDCEDNKLKSTKGTPESIGGEIKSDKHFISKVIDFVKYSPVDRYEYDQYVEFYKSIIFLVSIVLLIAMLVYEYFCN